MKKTTGILFGSIAGSALLIPLLVIAALILPTVILFFGTRFTPNQPAPEITYGEFPFTIQYEVMRKPYMIKDTVVCEFDGFSARGPGDPRHRDWKCYLKSGIDDTLILFQDDDTQIVFSLTLDFSDAQIYMDDPNRRRDNLTTDLGYRIVTDGIPGKFKFISEEELWEQYQFKLTHVQFSEPIQNTFK